MVTTKRHSPLQALTARLFDATASSQRSWLALICLVALAPFVDKALNIDDTLFVWAAEHILSAPAAPYRFLVNWYDTVQPLYEVMQNPPLTPYFLALLLKMPGASILTLHLAYLGVAVLAVLGVFELAREYGAPPLFAALASLGTPVFLVCSSSLMCDVPLLCLWVWSMTLWLRGTKSERGSLKLAAVLLLTLCGLTKYSGICLFPLLFLHCLLRGKKGFADARYLLMPLAAWGVYELWATRQFGQGFFLQALSYAADLRGQGRSLLHRAVLGFSFLGGCLLPLPLFFALRKGFRWRPWCVAWAALATLLFATNPFGWLPARASGGQGLLFAAHLALFSMAGVATLVAAGRRLRASTSEALLLPLWLLGIFCFALFCNWDINGRSFLLATPPLAVLVALEVAHLGERRPAALGLLLAGLLLSLALGRAEYVWANSMQHEAEALASEYQTASPKPLFKGHWGFQYYMEKAGFKPLDARRDTLAPGDALLIAFNTSHSLRLPLEKFELRGETRRAPVRWATITHANAGAGFHSSLFGPLPYLLFHGEEDVYRTYRALVTLGPTPQNP